jgi:hypothetical protein
MELTAGEAVSAAASDTSADVTFTGASGLSLSAADFTVSSGGTISDVNVSDYTGTATVSVSFAANIGATPKTYSVSIATDSAKIRGDATVVITQAAATGSANITIGFNYGEITITGSDGSNVISKSGAYGPSSLSLSATGYTDVVWYVDGSSTGISGSPVTLNAAIYSTKRHSIIFTGAANGHWYSSQPIPFVVNP